MKQLRSALFAAVAALVFASATHAEGWGTIKGQFVMADGKVPPTVKVNVNKDEQHCLSKGQINSEKYVVDPKSKGVRYVVVWITPEKNEVADHKTAPEIHPSLKAIKEKQLVVDQPCCKFEPHISVLRIGQEFVGKNSAPVAHNMKIESIALGGVNENLALVPGGSLTIAAEKWKPYHYPSSISCGIHPWMNAKLFVLAHPYFAVSDKDGNFEIKNVPAGKLRILMWHEIGWVHKKDEGKKGYDGQGITVEAGKTLDLGKIGVKYED